MSDNNMNSPDPKITEYLNSKNILWFPINLVVPKGKKKELLPYTETNKRPTTNDFKNLTPEEIQDRKKYTYQYIAIDTAVIQQFDIDSEEADQTFKKAKTTLPYFKSSSKGLPHYFFELNYKQSFGKHFVPPMHPKVDCLNGQWSFAERDTVIYNSHCSIEPFTIEPKQNAPSIPTAPQQDVTHTDEMIDALLQLISTEHFEVYDSWYKIGAALFNIKQTEHLFDKYSKPAKNYGGTDNLWRQFKRNPLSKIGIGTLCYYAKDSNPGQFCLWYHKYRKSILDIIIDGPKAVIESIIDDLKSVLVYSNKNWYHCGPTNVWRVCNKPDIHFQNAICKKLDEYICELAETKPADYNEKIKSSVAIKKQIDKKGFNTQLTDYGVELLNEKKFYSKLDMNRGYLAFKNGMYDLQTAEFRKGFKPDDFVLTTLDYEFPKRDTNQISKVKTLFKRICNNSDERMDFVMRVLGYSLTGFSYKEQMYFTFVGITAANGKSSLLEALAFVFPEFVEVLESDTFMKGNSTKHKSLANIHSKRIIYTEELPTGAELNTRLLKQMSQGGMLPNQKLFAKDEMIEVLCKIFMTSNPTPTFEADNGTERRYIQIEFISKFLSQSNLDKAAELNGGSLPKNHFLCIKNWKETILSLRAGVVHFMLDYAHKYFTNGFPEIPKDIQNDSKETCQDNDWFNDVWNELEQGNTYLLSKQDSLPLYQHHHKDFKSFKDGLKKRGIKYDSTIRKKGQKGFFVGVKIGDNCQLIDEEDPDDKNL